MSLWTVKCSSIFSGRGGWWLQASVMIIPPAKIHRTWLNNFEKIEKIIKARKGLGFQLKIPSVKSHPLSKGCPNAFYSLILVSSDQLFWFGREPYVVFYSALN